VILRPAAVRSCAFAPPVLARRLRGRRRSCCPMPCARARLRPPCWQGGLVAGGALAARCHALVRVCAPRVGEAASWPAALLLPAAMRSCAFAPPVLARRLRGRRCSCCPPSIRRPARCCVLQGNVSATPPELRVARAQALMRGRRCCPDNQLSSRLPPLPQAGHPGADSAGAPLTPGHTTQRFTVGVGYGGGTSAVTSGWCAPKPCLRVPSATRRCLSSRYQSAGWPITSTPPIADSVMVPRLLPRLLPLRRRRALAQAHAAHGCQPLPLSSQSREHCNARGLQSVVSVFLTRALAPCPLGALSPSAHTRRPQRPALRALHLLTQWMNVKAHFQIGANRESSVFLWCSTAVRHRMLVFRVSHVDGVVCVGGVRKCQQRPHQWIKCPAW
jgi:hypothetical protein